MRSDKEYHITRLTKDNLQDVAKLHKAVYGKSAPAGFFEKKYDTAYTGIRYTGYIAYNNDEIPIGYYGVIPCFLKDGERIILSAQSADTMTDPRHRYKGLFVELSNMTFDLCRSEGIKLIFGFPNQNSLHGAVNKLGWQMTEIMDCFIIPVKTVPLERITRRFSFLQPLYKKYVRSILAKRELPVYGIANSMITDGYSGVNRDEHYLAYKTYYKRHVIKIGESVLWVKINNGLIIGDMAVTPINFDHTMHVLQKLAGKLGLGQIQFHTNPGTTLHALFLNRYKAVLSFPALFQVLDPEIPLHAFKFTFADIDIF